jgi:lysophospholipase L1-like esterase
MWLASVVVVAAATSAISPVQNAPPASAPQPAQTSPNASTASTPTPREGERWLARHNVIVDQARTGGFELAFLGDSITEGWAGAGNEIWQQRFAPRHAINLGIGGDRTQHVLWRLNNDLLDALAQTDPANANHIKAIVLMIGTNNSNGNDNTAEEITDGIGAIVKSLREKLPQAKILLLGIFPRGEKPNPQREKNAKASELASRLADGKSIYYLDIGPKFLTEDGTLSKEIMPDFLHLSPKGYEIWADAIDQKLNELMAK